MAAAGIVMETINLPEGNAFGVDDVESGTPTVDYAEHQAKTLFFVWVTLTEQKWVIFGERRGASSYRYARERVRRCCLARPDSFQTLLRRRVIRIAW